MVSAGRKPFVHDEPVTDPEALYRSPEDIVRSTLPLDCKLELLAQWEQNVQQRLDATSEGMPANGTSSRDAGLIDDITRARRQLTGRQEGSAIRPDGVLSREEAPIVATPAEARQADDRQLNYRVLLNSLAIALIAGAMLYAIYYLALAV